MPGPTAEEMAAIAAAYAALLRARAPAPVAIPRWRLAARRSILTNAVARSR